jgi:dienelactone hydrolase
MKLQKMRLFVMLIAIIFTSGCSTYKKPQERIVAADVLAGQFAMRKTIIPTDYFPLLAYYRFSGIAVENAMMDVYIEGDGFAWVSRSQPSLDPTPINPVALKMAAKSRQANVAYIARPCQYIEADNEKVCNTSDWTSRRFSERAVAAVNAAIDELKLKSGAKTIRLTGFSGGGAIAALVAARRNDVELLITVAGNIEPVFWCEMHHLSALDGSLNPADFAARLEHVPQIHFVGEEDDNIPLAVAEAYRSAFKNAANIQVVTVPKFSHLCCWAEQWPQLLEPYLLLEQPMQ